MVCKLVKQLLGCLCVYGGCYSLVNKNIGIGMTIGELCIEDQFTKCTNRLHLI